MKKKIKYEKEANRKFTQRYRKRKYRCNTR